MLKKFINLDSTDNKVVQRSKNIIFAFALSIVVFISIIILFFSDNKNNKIKIDSFSAAQTKNKVDVASSLNIKAEDEWLSKSENDLKTIQEQNNVLLKRLEMLEKQQKESQESYGRTIDSLTGELANTRMQIDNVQNNGAEEPQYNEYGEIINRYRSNNIMSINIDLEDEIEVEGSNYNDINNYIPSGSYVTAKMLSGADVSTGTEMQKDPNNMMFEIVSPAIAPKYKGKAQEIRKVEGCRIMAEATGQLWTERAYIRLKKMTCSFEKGRTAEFTVKGYVTSFAKEGVRGKVVSREGYFTGMAFLAGAIEGIANVAETAYAPTLEVQTGLATETINARDVARQAGAGGFGKAAEILSDYYIKRAEQYQSVIDVPTGIEVEIVFMEGVDLSNNISFKLKANEVGGKVGTQMGRDANPNNAFNTPNPYINNGRANIPENNVAHSNNWGF